MVDDNNMNQSVLFDETPAHETHDDEKDLPDSTSKKTKKTETHAHETHADENALPDTKDSAFKKTKNTGEDNSQVQVKLTSEMPVAS